MPYGTSIGWNNLAANQAVSWDDLYDAVINWNFFGHGTNYSSMPTGNQEVYKSLPTYSLTTYINTILNSARASNDLLIKSDFNPIWDHTGTLYASNIIDGNVITGGWSSSSAACASGPSSTGPSTATVGWNGTLGSSSYYMYLVSTPGWILTNSSGSATYLYLSGNWIYMPYYYPSSSDNQVTSTGTCTPAYQTLILSLSNTNGGACSAGLSTVYVVGTYVIGGSLVGYTIYTNSALTVPRTGFTFFFDQTPLGSGKTYRIASATGVVTGLAGTQC